MRDRSSTSPVVRRHRPCLFVLVLTVALTHIACADEEPPGCSATAVAASLSAVYEGQPFPPGACAVPGQVVDYVVTLLVPGNLPGLTFCNVAGGQLSVTLPNWSSAPPGGGEKFVEMAGYPDQPTIVPFGNSFGGLGPFMMVCPTPYVVDPADAVDGYLLARADYGHTAWIAALRRVQENGVYQSDPIIPAATAVAKSGLSISIPELVLDLQVDVVELCDGMPIEVTWTCHVSNPGEADLAQPVLSGDEACPLELVSGDVFGDGRLNPGETWIYSCTETVTATTVRQISVSSMAVTFSGATVAGIEYADQAEATVNGVDQAAPTIEGCPRDPLLIVADAAGEAFAPDLARSLVIQDDCVPPEMLTYEQIPAPGQPLQIGSNPLSLTVTDFAGQSAVCQAVVEVVPFCAADLDGNGEVDVQDLIQLMLDWGRCPSMDCPSDLDGDGLVEVLDLIAMMLSWGVC